MRCPTHLSTGQEAVPAVLGETLTNDDLWVSSHRAHGHYLGKGGDLKRMIAEIYGKETGCSRGRGGSMHLTDREVGFVGSTAIVAGTIPVGVGLALALKLKKSPHICCVFFGDGATEEGVFYESVNFAVLKKLPVLFVCENNLYSVYSPLSVRQPKNRQIAAMVKGLGCYARHGDGNDPDAVIANLAPALAHIRSGEGPAFLEFATYRWREHCGPNWDNDLGYRTEAEFEQWKKRDPLVITEKYLSDEPFDFFNSAKSRQLKEIEDAFCFAENSSAPDRNDLFNYIYSS